MRFRLAFLAFPLVAALLAGACSGEGEGMPCDTRAGNGGNDDCANGLVCTALANVQGARCCPANRQTATTPECSLGSSTTDAASPAPPVDASSGDGPSSSDAATEAGSEAATGGDATGADGGGSDAATE